MRLDRPYQTTDRGVHSAATRERFATLGFHVESAPARWADAIESPAIGPA